MGQLHAATALAMLATGPAWAQANKTAPTPAPQQHLLPDGAPDALVGRWGDNGDCKHYVLLRGDGSFHSYTGGEGRWTVTDDMLAMAGPGGTMRLRVIEMDPDHMTVENANGSIGHSQRCEEPTTPENDGEG